MLLNLVYALVAASILTGIGLVVRPVRIRVKDLWRLALHKPRSRLRIQERGPFQLFWSWSPDSEGVKRLGWVAVLAITNDGDRINSVVNGILKFGKYKTSFGPPEMMWMHAGVAVPITELGKDQHAEIFLRPFIETPIANKPHTGNMQCRLKFNDRYGRSSQLRLVFQENPA